MFLEHSIGKNKKLRLEPIAEGVIRVRVSEMFEPSLAERYQILFAEPDADFSQDVLDNSVRAGKLMLTLDTESKCLLMDADGAYSVITIPDWNEEEAPLWKKRRQWLVEHLEHWCDVQGGDSQAVDENTHHDACTYDSPTPPFGVAMTLTEKDRIYGFGEAADEFLVFNGKTVLNRVLYHKNEIPIPLAMSSRGWGIFVNTASWHGADIGAKEKNVMYFYGDHGAIDFFVIQGKFMLGLTQKYTRLTGASCMLPKWMYGLSFIENYYARNYDVLADAREFRRENFPCDMFSLEPGWMEKNYDESITKEWSDSKFMIRDWMRPNRADHPNQTYDRSQNYGGTFAQCLQRMHYKLSVWLCCVHDLSAEEERRAGNDTDFGIEPWFDHLKKFVNDGVDGFKTDPAHYTDTSDPNRRYANGLRDPEFHNLIQTILSKQMSIGFEEFTGGRRIMHHFCGGYSGTQHWGATTCGDSGGGCKSLGWILNLGMHGFPHVTVDMEMHIKERMHYAMFTAWPLLDSWAGFFQPWYAGDELEKIFREYVELRYRTIPYSYSAALECFVTSMPIARAMPMAYPQIAETADVITQYMYGPSVLVSAFTDRIYFPEGKWYDVWKKQEFIGGGWMHYDVPDDRGGGCFLKSGAIVPMWSLRNYIDCKDETHMELFVYAGENHEYVLYEDDGDTHAYRKGEYAATKFDMQQSSGELRLVIHSREGYFDGMESQRDWKVTVVGLENVPTSVAVNGEPAEFVLRGGELTFGMEGPMCSDLTAVIR